MLARKFFPRTRTTILIAMSICMPMFAAHSFASSPVEKTLHRFSGFPDGSYPETALVADKAGNLYGTTLGGGSDAACSCGTVFELSPPANPSGAWSETVLYSFKGNPTDGAQPYGTLIFDKQSNLYGTTVTAGEVNGTGTVFELSPPANPGGAWTETLLYNFPPDQSQGAQPSGKLAFEGVGNLYGTTLVGGTSPSHTPFAGGGGTVFQLKPPATPGGAWTEKLLYTFGSVANGGLNPIAGVSFHAGALYGTTAEGGSGSLGTVFQLVPKNGSWTESILYNFTGSNGANPNGTLVLDDAGNLYGITINGGFSDQVHCVGSCGTVFELSPSAVAGGAWQETTLYTFNGGAYGGKPIGGVIRDKLNNLYGTASGGGDHGTAYRLSPPATAGGRWTPSLLHTFHGRAAGDGASPWGELILFNGTFYGTTASGGGIANVGTVFSVTR